MKIRFTLRIVQQICIGGGAAAIMAAASTDAMAQDGPKWSTGLNSASGTDALGTSNNFPLIIKTNGVERLRVMESGELLLKNTAFYNGNYSSLFTSRSLVDKGYVDSSLAALPPPVIPTLAAVLMAGRNADGIGLLQDNTGMQTLNLNMRRLYNSQGIVKVDWEQGLLYNAAPGNVVSLRWIQRELVGFDGITASMNWGARWLYNDGGQLTLDWQDRKLQAGNWEYDADYSANYTARSLVDKGYLDARISALPPPPLPAMVFIQGSGQYSAMNNQSGNNNAQAPYSFIGGGQMNSVYPNATYGAIITGQSNRIENFLAPQPIHNLIGSGSNNVIKHNANYAAILSGSGNTVDDHYSLILAGLNNTIEAPAAVATSFNTIHNGAGNRIKSNASFSSILNGNGNTIRENSHYSMILGGTNNSIGINLINTIVLGGSNITATQSNMVYMPGIALPSLAGSGDRMLLVDANGNFKSGGPVTQALGGWTLGGNDLTPSPGAYLGTNSAHDLVFQTDASGGGGERMRITAAGRIGMGTSAPQQLLELNGGINNTFARIGNNNGRIDLGFNGAHGILDADKDLLINWYSEKNTIIGGPNNGSLTVNHDAYFSVLSGSVGIGTLSPYKKLTVIGDVSFVNHDYSTSGTLNSFEILGNNAIPSRRGISLDNDPNGGMNFYVHAYQGNSGFNFLDGNPNATRVLMRIDAVNQMVVINDEPTNPYLNPAYKLAVNGKVIAEEFLVRLRSSGWPDYVFSNEYKLRSLFELEEFIKQNKHLPGIPCAANIGESGLPVGELVTLQMEKIEELTLYMIELNKKLEALMLENQKLKSALGR